MQPIPEIPLLWLDAVPAWPAIGIVLSPAAVSAEQWHQKMRPQMDAWLAGGGQVQILRKDDLEVSFVNLAASIEYHFNHSRCWVRALPAPDATDSAGRSDGTLPTFGASQALVLVEMIRALDLIAETTPRRVERIGIVASGTVPPGNPPPGILDWLSAIGGGKSDSIDKLELAVSRQLVGQSGRVGARYALQIAAKDQPTAFTVDWQWQPQAGDAPTFRAGHTAEVADLLRSMVPMANSHFQTFAAEGIHAGVFND